MVNRAGFSLSWLGTSANIIVPYSFPKSGSCQSPRSVTKAGMRIPFVTRYFPAGSQTVPPPESAQALSASWMTWVLSFIPEVSASKGGLPTTISATTTSEVAYFGWINLGFLVVSVVFSLFISSLAVDDTCDIEKVLSPVKASERIAVSWLFEVDSVWLSTKPTSLPPFSETATEAKFRDKTLSFPCWQPARENRHTPISINRISLLFRFFTLLSPF